MTNEIAPSQDLGGTTTAERKSAKGRQTPPASSKPKKPRAPAVPGRKRGRPASVGGAPRNIRLTDEQALTAMALGEQNLNQGVRTALDTLALISQIQDQPHLQADIDFVCELGHGSFQRGLLGIIGAARKMKDMGDLGLLDDELEQIRKLGSGSLADGMRIGMRLANQFGQSLSAAFAAKALAPQELEALARIGHGDAVAGLRLCLKVTTTLGPDVARKLADGN